MDVYHNKCALIDTYIAEGGIFHPESILGWAIQRAGVKVLRTEILFDTLRKNGARVRPTWDERYGDVLPPWKRQFTAA